MSQKKSVGVQFVETVRVGKRTFAFGVYRDAKVGKIPFAGLAEKYPTDKENPVRGRNFALGRAFENLGKEIAKHEWNQLKRSSNSKPTVAKKLSSKEKAELMNTPEAIKKREERAKKHVKESAKTSKPTVKKNTEVSKERKSTV